MKKIFKNPLYMCSILGAIVSLILLITFIFIRNRTYFSIAFAINIVINFLVVGFILLKTEKEDKLNKFSLIIIYLLFTLFLLWMDIVIINNVWNLNVYDNLMYVTNIKLYLMIYSVYVAGMTLISIYVLLKDKLLDNSSVIRQKSSKQ